MFMLMGGYASPSKSATEEGTIASAEIALVYGLMIGVGCQDRLCVNSDADKTLA